MRIARWAWNSFFSWPWKPGTVMGVPFSVLKDGYDIRTVQELPGRGDVKTTMIYTHVLNRGGRGVRSPLEGLGGLLTAEPWPESVTLCGPADLYNIPKRKARPPQ